MSDTIAILAIRVQVEPDGTVRRIMDDARCAPGTRSVIADVLRDLARDFDRDAIREGEVGAMSEQAVA